MIVGYDLSSQDIVWRVPVCEGATLYSDVNPGGDLLVTGSSTEQCKALKLWSRTKS
jgi:hypothetical protein